jgi:hypothetical protein
MLSIESIMGSPFSANEITSVINFICEPSRAVLIIEQYNENEFKLIFAGYKVNDGKEYPIIKFISEKRNMFKDCEDAYKFLYKEKFITIDDPDKALNNPPRRGTCDQRKTNQLCMSIIEDQKFLSSICEKAKSGTEFLCQLTDEARDLFPIGYSPLLWAGEKLIKIGLDHLLPMGYDPCHGGIDFFDQIDTSKINKQFRDACKNNDCIGIREIIRHYPNDVSISGGHLGRWLNATFDPPLMLAIKDRTYIDDKTSVKIDQSFDNQLLPDVVALLLYLSKRLKKNVYEKAKVGYMSSKGPIAYLFDNYIMKCIFLHESEVIMHFLRQLCPKKYYSEISATYKTEADYKAIYDTILTILYNHMLIQTDGDNKKISYLYKIIIEFLDAIITTNKNEKIKANAQIKLGWLYQNGFECAPKFPDEQRLSQAYQLYLNAAAIDKCANLYLALCCISNVQEKGKNLDEKEEKEAKGLYLDFVKLNYSTSSARYKKADAEFSSDIEKCSFFMRPAIEKFKKYYKSWQEERIDEEKAHQHLESENRSSFSSIISWK